MIRLPPLFQNYSVSYLDKSFLLLWPHRLTVRTSAFQAGNRGSIPLGATSNLTPSEANVLSAGNCSRSELLPVFKNILGRLAQLGERIPYKDDVVGSIPTTPTIH